MKSRDTADRSLAIVDYALRRRFGFVYLEPKFSSEKFREYLKTFDVKEELTWLKPIVDWGANLRAWRYAGLTELHQI